MKYTIKGWCLPDERGRVHVADYLGEPWEQVEIQLWKRKAGAMDADPDAIPKRCTITVEVEDAKA